jgi:hypothetical protein
VHCGFFVFCFCFLVLNAGINKPQKIHIWTYKKWKSSQMTVSPSIQCCKGIAISISITIQIYITEMEIYFEIICYFESLSESKFVYGFQIIWYATFWKNEGTRWNIWHRFYNLITFYSRNSNHFDENVENYRMRIVQL